MVPRYLFGTDCTSKSAKSQTIGNMSIITFYFLLRVGESTYYCQSENRQTKQFCFSDITLWHNTTRLDPHIPLKTLHELCKAATISISNQNNEKTISSHSSGSNPQWVCPICALICRLHHILANTSNPNTIISTYFQTPSCKGRGILAIDTNKGVKSAVTLLGLDNNDLRQDLVVWQPQIESKGCHGHILTRNWPQHHQENGTLVQWYLPHVHTWTNFSIFNRIII